MTTLQHLKVCYLLTILLTALALFHFADYEEVNRRVYQMLRHGSDRNSGRQGIIDTTSHWRRLGRTTNVFSAYLDDRNPYSIKVTVMGFGESLETPLNGTLLLTNGSKIRLGQYSEKKKSNPSGGYTRRWLGGYGYIWRLPAEIANATYLTMKSIVVQQTYENELTAAEISISRPVHSTMTFGVCIDSPLYGTIEPRTIIENIEMNKVLGAEWFTVYFHTSDRAVLQVFYDYASEGIVEIVQNWGQDLPNVTYFGQRLSINECAYRNMFRVKYLVYTDLDEYIIPKRSLGWAGLMKEIDHFKYGAFVVRHVYFTKNSNTTVINTRSMKTEFSCNESDHVQLPRYLTWNFRSMDALPPYRRSKYIIKPFYTSVVGVHRIFKYVEPHIRDYIVSPDQALLHHYRKVIQRGERKRIRQFIPDERALVYKEKVATALRTRLCKNNRI